jgi:hypothetical protein
VDPGNVTHRRNGSGRSGRLAGRIGRIDRGVRVVLPNRAHEASVYMGMRGTVTTAVLILCMSAGSTGGAEQTHTLPDPDAFLHEVRARLESDEERQREYMYVETRREQRLDGSGRPVEESVKIFESYPGLPGERRWRRLIEENGTPVPPADLARQDRERREHVEAYERAQAALSDAERAGRAQRGDDRGSADERVNDAFRVFTFRMIGRERIDGHDTVVFAMEPRPNAPARTREGRIMRHFHGRAWVHEADHELVRLEVQALNDVTIGWGLVGRIHKGSAFSFARLRLEDGTWVPARSRYIASARVMLVRRVRLDGSTEYSDYRRLASQAARSEAAGPEAVQ